MTARAIAAVREAIGRILERHSETRIPFTDKNGQKVQDYIMVGFEGMGGP